MKLKRLIGMAVLILAGSVALVCALYLLLRPPELRAVDFLHFNRDWQYRMGRLAALPQSLEPFLERHLLIEYKRITHKLPSGLIMELNPKDLVDRRFLVAGTYEEQEWDWVASRLGGGGAFIDVGAHHGAYSLNAARLLGEAGQVLAIEPNPRAAELLRRQAALNSLSNITIIEKACGSSRNTMTLYVSPDSNTGMTSLSYENAVRGSLEFTPAKHDVEIVPLDLIVSENLKAPTIALIKVDTEGAETEVIRGAAGVIRKYKPWLLLETHAIQLDNFGSSLKELRELVRSLGYRQAASNGNNALWAPLD